MIIEVCAESYEYAIKAEKDEQVKSVMKVAVNVLKKS